MIEFVKHSKIDKSKWDSLVDMNKGLGHWFSKSWFLEANYSKWDALIYGDYECALPLPRSHFLKHHRVYQPFFTRAYQVLGNTDAAIEKQFYDFLTHSKIKGSFCLHSSVELTEKRVFQVLNLEVDYKFSKNTIRNINKAKNANINITEMDVKSFVSGFEKYTGKLLTGYKSKHYAYLEKLLSSAEENNCLKLISAQKSSETLAATAFLISENKALYLAAFVSDAGKKVGASHFITNAFIETNSQLKSLDFGGSNVESVARFYKGFAADDSFYSLFEF